MLPPCDLAVAGAGPAGLSCAINAASEGLRVSVLEPHRIGGQAHWSSAIENLAGFPDAISGKALATRMHQQAQRFGVRFVADALTTFCAMEDKTITLQTHGGCLMDCRSLVIATGLTPKPLTVPGSDLFGVFVGANPDELQRFAGKTVAIIGGGNAAGQATAALIRVRAAVTVFVRRSLVDTMSAYLIDRIVPNATVKEQTPIDRIDPSLPQLRVNGGVFDAVFTFIGSHPSHAFPLDTPNAYLSTDSRLSTATSGVFAIGDVRAGNQSKRIATAIGDGASVVASLHSFLKGSV